jgi:hypothetical protein
MKNPEPVPYEQALANAMLWTKKAGQIALDAGKAADAQRLAVAASVIERIYLEGAAVYADEPDDHLTDESAEPAPIGITVKRRFSDYHASIDGSNETQWGCGKSIDEAVGSVVRNQQERLGLKIKV